MVFGGGEQGGCQCTAFPCIGRGQQAPFNHMPVILRVCVVPVDRFCRTGALQLCMMHALRLVCMWMHASASVEHAHASPRPHHAYPHASSAPSMHPIHACAAITLLPSQTPWPFPDWHPILSTLPIIYLSNPLRHPGGCSRVHAVSGAFVVPTSMRAPSCCTPRALAGARLGHLRM